MGVKSGGCGASREDNVERERVYFFFCVTRVLSLCVCVYVCVCFSMCVHVGCTAGMEMQNPETHKPRTLAGVALACLCCCLKKKDDDDAEGEAAPKEETEETSSSSPPANTPEEAGS